MHAALSLRRFPRLRRSCAQDRGPLRRSSSATGGVTERISPVMALRGASLGAWCRVVLCGCLTDTGLGFLVRTAISAGLILAALRRMRLVELHRQE
jgi:hypothetical protein